MRPTASSLWLAELCPASHVLPQVRETSAASERGTAIHKYLELVPQLGVEAALAAIPEPYREQCSELDPADLPRGRREVALLYDLVSRVGIQGRNISERNYPTAPNVACGTADVIADRQVWDYKSGWPGPANESLQLLALGLFAARTFAWLRVTVGHLRVDDDRLHPDSADLGPIDLAAAHERIARIYERHEQAKGQESPDVYPGEHCTMCAAAPACPATTALSRRVAEAISDQQRIAAMVDADPAGAWVFLKRAEDAMERLRAELKRRASIESIPLHNGKRLAIVEVDKTRIDGKIGLPLLRDALPGVDGLCSVSKGRLEKAVGKKSAQILLERLSAAGAIEEHTERHLREVRPEAA